MLGSQTPRTQTEGSGKIVYTFGNPSLIKSASWSSSKPQNIIPKQLIQHEGQTLTSKTKYMYDNLSERIAIDADKLFEIGQKICKKKFGEDTSLFKLVNVDEVSQDEVLTIGRIFCEFGGKLDATSTMLLGSNEFVCRTQLEAFQCISRTDRYDFWIKSSWRHFNGERNYHRQISFKSCGHPEIEQDLSIVVAAGPFTNSEDLHYDPLNDLLLYCKDNKPDCLILIGPFMDVDHAVIRGEIVLDKSFETFFEEMLASVVEVVGSDVTICCVSSYKDVCADSVYPTLPMSLKKQYPNVHMLPDPSIIELKSGLVLGITSVDVTDHILEYELAVNAGDKVKRVVNHLFNQETFYPLQPPADEEMCFDGDLASKFTKIDQIPNILILPSNQNRYIRDINNCLTINPGRLTDAKGGTFARMMINPPKEGDKLMNYVACQVRRI
uniref:DNA polymerase alpha subunit B n=1 Tax=Megaselia scalaris TaxID=36166 RepID=T1GQV8_MEGSC